MALPQSISLTLYHKTHLPITLGMLEIFHTNLFSNSFFPSTIRAWNDRPNDIKNAPNVASFKYKINKNLRSLPKFYNAGTRKGQILHLAILQIKCSFLNSDLHRKNIVHNPSCRCGDINFKSRNHFFFACPLYSLDKDDLNKPLAYCQILSL